MLRFNTSRRTRSPRCWSRRASHALAACATPGTPVAPAHAERAAAAPNREPPPPHVNLRAFRLPYRQGYRRRLRERRGTERKDAARFGNDGNYRTAGRTASRSMQGKRVKLARVAGVVDVRGLRYHVRDVGRRRAPKLLHAARLDGRRRVVPVPGRRARATSGTCSRRTGAASASREWQPQDGYWFPITSPISTRWSSAVAPDAPRAPRRAQPRRQRRDALGGRAPATACRHVVALDGFGIPCEAPERAPGKLAKWLDALRDPPVVRAVRGSRRRRRPPAEEQSAPVARQGRVPRRRTGRSELPDGTRASCASDPQPQAAVPDGVAHGRRCSRSGAASRAPVLWVAAAHSRHPALARPPRRRCAIALEESRARFAHVPHRHARGRARMPATCCITTSRRPSRA